MLKTFSYRLRPSASQARLLEGTNETCRRFYRQRLAERKEAFEIEGCSVTKVERLRHAKECKASDPYAKSVRSHILQVVVSDLDQAFQAFFRRVKAGGNPGYPLSKSVLDAGWGYFAHRLSAKAEEAGKTVCVVNPAYASKSRSHCGAIFEDLKLSDRWILRSCGLSLDRDHNAAMNVLKRAGRAPWSVSLSMDGSPRETAPL